MKVYISTDMEGITGICCPEFTMKGNPYYQEGRKLLTGDVNAAVEGALAGGAAEVIVADMHDGSFNLIHEEVHPEAKVIYGIPHRGVRFPYLDRSVDCMFLIGYHAKAGTLHATLEHTMSSADWFKVAVNGKEIGEIGVDAGLAGSAGVPVVLVTGDDKACSEAKKLLGDVQTAVVKWGLARRRALCLSKQKTRELIFEAAKDAMKRTQKVKPLTFASPVTVKIVHKHTELADGVNTADANEKRLDAYTVAHTYRTFADWYGGIWKKSKGKD